MLAALLARLITHSIVKEVIIRIMFKKLFTKFLMSRLGKGKLTYTGLVILLVPAFDAITGADLTSADVTGAIAGVGAVMVVLGKLRATYQAHKAGIDIGAAILDAVK